MSTTRDWVARAKDASMNGFTLDALIGEAIGAASVCWTSDDRIFDTEQAEAIRLDFQAALAAFLKIAVNQQSLDARADMADWEVVELLLQAPSVGFGDD